MSGRILLNILQYAEEKISSRSLYEVRYNCTRLDDTNYDEVEKLFNQLNKYLEYTQEDTTISKVLQNLVKKLEIVLPEEINTSILNLKKETNVAPTLRTILKSIYDTLQRTYPKSSDGRKYKIKSLKRKKSKRKKSLKRKSKKKKSLKRKSKKKKSF